MPERWQDSAGICTTIFIAAEQLVAADNACASLAQAACNWAKSIGAKKNLISYHGIVPGKAASVMPSFAFGVAAELGRSAPLK